MNLCKHNGKIMMHLTHLSGVLSRMPCRLLPIWQWIHMYTGFYDNPHFCIHICEASHLHVTMAILCLFYFYLYTSITYSTSWTFIVTLVEGYLPPQTSQGRVNSHEAKIDSKAIESLSSSVNEPERECAKHGGKYGCMHHATHTRSYLVFFSLQQCLSLRNKCWKSTFYGTVLFSIRYVDMYSHLHWHHMYLEMYLETRKR